MPLYFLFARGGNKMIEKGVAKKFSPPGIQGKRFTLGACPPWHTLRWLRPAWQCPPFIQSIDILERIP